MRFRIAGVAIVAVAATALFAGGGQVSAQQDPAQLAKERHQLMEGLWPNYYQAMAQFARGQNTDAAAIPEKARQAAAAVRRIPALFPAGSGRDAVPATRARPSIWEERAEFEANAEKLAVETERLGEIAKGGDIEAFKAQDAVVSQACTACHGGPPKSGGKFRFREE